MRLAIFGGTGRVGRRLIEYASGSGHTVQVLVRDPSRISSHQAARVVPGDVTDPAAVRRVVAGAETVLSALGGAGLAQPGTILSTGMRNIATAMALEGVHRVLAVAGSGVLDTPAGGLRADAPDFPAIYRPITEEHIGTWRALRDSDLLWTLVCCPDLLDGERTGQYRAQPDLLPAGGQSISVEDTADFMLAHLTDTTTTRRRIGLAY